MSATNPIQSRDYEIVQRQNPENFYMTINRPQVQEVTPNPSSVNKFLTNKHARKTLFALVVAFLVCVLIVSLVAVVMYSPLVQGPTGGESPAQQESATATQNDTSYESLQEALTSVQDKLANYDAVINTLNLVQARLANYETTVNTRLANYDTTINTLHNSLESVSSVQNTLSQNFDQLRTFDLYQGCFEETRTCSLPTFSEPDYVSCYTSSLNINPQDTTNFVSSVRCEFSNTNYFTSHALRKSGNSIQCRCQVTYPIHGGHGSFSTSGTCTLTVTKCPRSQTVP